MYNIKLIIIAFLGLPLIGLSQVNQNDKKTIDSLLKNDALWTIFDSLYKPKDYLKINVGIGNGLFSVRNNDLNSLEINHQLIIKPSVSYFHKSGLALSVEGYLPAKVNAPVYQFAVSPSYLYNNRNFTALVSYTRYFIPDKYNLSASPIQNDFYSSVVLKKPWLKPGLGIDYASGIFNEIVRIDTLINTDNEYSSVSFIDTLSAKIKSFSVMGTVEHSFKAYGIFNKNDAFNFTTQFIVAVNSSNFQVSHKSSVYNYNTFTKKKKKRVTKFFDSASSSETSSTPFRMESVGLNLDADYAIGKFNFQPQVYLDYYLPSTSTKRFTQILNFSIGYRF